MFGTAESRVPWHKDHTMTLRRILPALFASALLLGSFAASAEAAPARAHRHAAHRTATHRAAAHHAAPHATRMSNRATTARRGGDAQNATVDQLNAQSLQRAQTGAPAQ